MIWRRVKQAWDHFFFTPQSPVSIALFRILYGLCVSATVILVHSDWLAWFGVHGWVSLATVTQIETGVRLNLFTVLPQDDRWIAALFWIFLVFALLLTVGLWTRVSSVAVFLCLVSIQQRNLWILHGGDVFLRVAGFFLMFAPSGAALSLDRWLLVRRGVEGSAIKPKAPWAQRMIQIELAVMYIMSALWKVKGHTAWLQGTALYYVIHLHAMARFPLPGWIHHPTVLEIGSRLTPVLEFSLGTLIWFRRVRYPVLLLGVLFHLSLEYALNVPMFQWDILAAYVLFVDPADAQRLWRTIVSRCGSRRRTESPQPNL